MISMLPSECKVERKPDSKLEDGQRTVKASKDCFNEVVSDNEFRISDGGSIEENKCVDLSMADSSRVLMQLGSAVVGSENSARISGFSGGDGRDKLRNRSEEVRVSFGGESRTGTSEVAEPEVFCGEDREGTVKVNADQAGANQFRASSLDALDKMEDEVSHGDGLDVPSRQGRELFDAQNDSSGGAVLVTDGCVVTTVVSFNGSGDQSGSNGAGPENFSAGSDGSRSYRHANEESGAVTQHHSLLSRFDNYVAIGKAMSKRLGNGLELGDMVWGKVKSHPWWPGHLYNEAFVSHSVRRTKREGHVLVAFFGDSSYGWFDPTELIPFDPNFAEKSKQTNLKNFMKAVDEAIDEACRRHALGLTCMCRNKHNFLPTNVQGYFSVDVPDYEPGGFYSANQIVKARNSFRPAETLSYIMKLALAPQDSSAKGISWIKNKAAVLAYRKAVFEEFDETYAQAFGYQAVRQYQQQKRLLGEPVKEPPQAPLSGLLARPESLSGRKSSSKAVKVKEQLKKDRYLLKRRDEPNISRNHRSRESQPNSSAIPTFLEGLSAPEIGDHLTGEPVRGAATACPKFEATPLPEPSRDEGKGALPESKIRKEFNPAGVTSSASRLDGKAITDSGLEGDGEKVVSSSNDFPEPEPSFSVHKEEQFQDVCPNDAVPKKPDDTRSPERDVKMQTNGGGVEAKSLKRPISNSNLSLVEVKKKKKKKNGCDPEFGTDQFQKHPATTGKEKALSGLVSRESNSQKVEKLCHSSPAAARIPLPGARDVDLELPWLLSDLKALALDPFHGLGRNCPDVVGSSFSRFRRVVFEKSLVVAPTVETDPTDARPNVSRENSVRDVPSLKPSKPIFRPENLTKSGRKRGPSDRQEEITAKKLKKLKDLKERKAGMKPPDSSRTEKKDSAGTPVPVKPVRTEPAKKSEPPARTEVNNAPAERMEALTMLEMKFPPKTSLPSVAELKARFARFGPLDHNCTRVFWKSSTCRVVFRYKDDAQTAYESASRNKNLFGNSSVFYRLKEVVHFDDSPLEHRKSAPDPPAPAPVQAPPPPVQLKSCLKKASGEEAEHQNGAAAGNGRGAARVKFMLGGEEGSSGCADGGATSSVGMDNFTRNNQKVVSSTLAPVIPPLTSHFANPPPAMRVNELVPPLPPLPPPPPPPPRTKLNLDASAPASASTPAGPSAVDVSQQMLNLLARCSDVVANVNSFLGYVPYHPL